MKDISKDLRQVAKCVEYVDSLENAEKLIQWLKSVTITRKFLRCGQMLWDKNGENRNIYRFTFTNQNGDKANVIFGDSIYNSMEGIEPDLYNILCCISSDMRTYFNSYLFSDFCAEFGYNEDSINAKKTYNLIQRQGKKLELIIKEDDLNGFPK